ncbi:MAG: phosphate propanoyltransferase [Erysipelotrichales bacterium]|nr:phosphate propanoyltransferase [Erysipelotrichales bacterium]
MTKETKIPCGISARHIHLSTGDLYTLFGDGYVLTKQKDLSQPGQYACEEKVNVVSPSGKVLEGVRILGPVRPATQLEISRSDAIRHKFTAPVRSSGDIAGSGSARLIGPKGEVEIKEGVIVADRHIHMSIEDGKKYGVSDREIVMVKVQGKKGGILHNVLCRVHKDFALDFHLDTDDACAFEINNGDLLEIVK